jgi:hypothetical protein
MSEATIQDLRTIKKLRAELGLSPIRKGYRDCLSCGKNFLSQDLLNQKTCNHCRQDLKGKNET